MDKHLGTQLIDIMRSICSESNIIIIWRPCDTNLINLGERRTKVGDFRYPTLKGPNLCKDHHQSGLPDIFQNTFLNSNLHKLYKPNSRVVKSHVFMPYW